MLRDLDVLRDKTEADVTGILGQPGSRRENAIEWYAGSSMHVNPFFRVVLAGGKVQSVSCNRR